MNMAAKDYHALSEFRYQDDKLTEPVAVAKQRAHEIKTVGEGY
jgi:hypothetical protein